MFAAYSHLQLGSRHPAFFGADSDQLAHSILIQHLERIVFKNPVLYVEGQEFAGVVPRDAIGGLRKIVGAE